MSIFHYLKTKDPINFDMLQKVIERTVMGVKYKQRSETLCYFWIDKASTRGVDVSLEAENWIELRNTGFSSKEDYSLTNELANSICNLYGGHLYSDNDQKDALVVLLDDSLFPNDRLPTTRNRCEPYLFQRDDTGDDWRPCAGKIKIHDGIDYLMAFATMTNFGIRLKK